jgi:hypothetical protein
MVQTQLNLAPPPERAVGDYWSRVFADMMLAHFGIHKFDKAPSPIVQLPNGDKIILADVLVLEHGGGNYYCEIKHKDPDTNGDFGLEGYRYHSLLTLQEWVSASVLYVIHDHSLQPYPTRKERSSNKENNPLHWKGLSIYELSASYKTGRYSPSYINGVLHPKVWTWYWNNGLWHPLSEILNYQGNGHIKTK